MDVWLSRNGQRYGPHSDDEFDAWRRDGRLDPNDLYWHAGMPDWQTVGSLSGAPPPLPPNAQRVSAAFPASSNTASDDDILRRIADYERLSAIFWCVLAVIQICTIVLALIGIWNLVAALTRFALVPRIRARDATIPKAYEGIAGIVIIGVLNLLLGGIIGVAFAAFDWYIRDLVLRNRHLFEQHGANIAAVTA